MPEISEQNITAVAPEKSFEQPDAETVQRVAERVEQLPGDLKEILGPEERRYLALIAQKDGATFEHSLGVAGIGQEELKEFSGDLANEGVSREAFLRACALHDVGKLRLPDCILKGTITQAEFERGFFRLKDSNPEFINGRLRQLGMLPEEGTVQDVPDESIQQMKLDYRDFVSLRQCYENNPAALAEISEYGFDPDGDSFMDALRRHEQKSQEIIEQSTVPEAAVVAQLAGSHHHYSKQAGETLPQSREVLRISVVASELLHLADVLHAVRQSRTYQAAYSEVGSLNIIMKETQRGIFRVDIAKRWIRRALAGLGERHHALSLDEETQYADIEKFAGS